MTEETSHAVKMDPVDVVLLIVLDGVIPFFPNLFLGFFPFGQAVGNLIGALLAGIIVGIARKGKRPPLLIAHERMRLARCATLVLLVLSLLIHVLAVVVGSAPFSPPLIGALTMEPELFWIVTLVGVPLETWLIFLATRSGLRIGVGRLVTPTVSTQGTHKTPTQATTTRIKPLGVVLIVLLLLRIALDGALVFHHLSVLTLFSQTTDVQQVLAKISGDWPNLMILLVGSDYIVAFVIFLVWLNQAYKNLYALGAQGLASTPGWAIGWWFVPVMNLFKPYQVFSQLWKASDPEFDLRDPKSWNRAPGSLLMPFWWGFSLLSWASFRITGNAVNLQKLKIWTFVSIGTNAAHLIAGALMIFLVWTVSQRQASRQIS